MPRLAMLVHTVRMGLGLRGYLKKGTVSLFPLGPFAYEHLCLSLGQAPGGHSKNWLPPPWRCADLLWQVCS